MEDSACPSVCLSAASYCFEITGWSFRTR